MQLTKVNSKLYLFIATLIVVFSTQAAELKVIGVDSAPIAGNPPATVRILAIEAAKKKALQEALKKVMGPDAPNRPDVIVQMESLLSQAPEGVITSSQTVGDRYKVTLELTLDDKTFKQQLMDLKLFDPSATRNFSVLAVFDEYLTTPLDLNMPLKQVVEFSSKVGATYKGRAAAASSASADSSYARDTRLDARQASSVDARSDQRVDASRNDKLSASGSANLRAGDASYGANSNVDASRKENLSASDKRSVDARQASSLKASDQEAAHSSSKAAAASYNNVDAEKHNDQYFKSVVEYQPHNAAPEQVQKTYPKFAGQLGDYDVKVLDNDMFRSKYFKSKPLTLDQITNSSELAKYVEAARKDAKADFFMVGAAVVVKGTINDNTGRQECSGFLSVKAYSTATSEIIAADTYAENGAGKNIDECRSDVSEKMASIGGPIIAEKIQTYWKRRSDFGQQYVIKLTGAQLGTMIKANFTKAVRTAEGVKSMQQRDSTDIAVEVTATYTGSGVDTLLESLMTTLGAFPAFANVQDRVEGTNITLCMSNCAPVKIGNDKKKKAP
jgi:hypothetical protein